MSVEAWSTWEAPLHLISTRLSGDLHLDDVEQWQDGLQQAVSQVEDDKYFNLLADLSGYELHDMAAHRAMRGVIPQLLAAHGLRAAVFDLYPEVKVNLTRTRGIICRAYANVHHDVDKMTEYERALGRANQRFFTDAPVARNWLLSLAGDSNGNGSK